MKLNGIWGVLLVTAGCAAVDTTQNPDDEAAQPLSELAEVRPVARPDETTDVAEAPQGALRQGTLGQTIASLGDARTPGLWLRTPLVTREQPGRVTFGGNSVNVQLLPLDAPPTAGSRISLQAMQALRAPLTGLLELTVVAL